MRIFGLVHSNVLVPQQQGYSAELLVPTFIYLYQHKIGKVRFSAQGRQANTKVVKTGFGVLYFYVHCITAHYSLGFRNHLTLVHSCIYTKNVRLTRFIYLVFTWVYLLPTYQG